MKRYSVKEGNTGVLELIDDAGNVEIYQPDYDLDKAQSLLYEFYNIQTNKGVKVKDAFHQKGIDWFPTTISMLYWQYFYQVVKYRHLLEKYLHGEIVFKSISPGKFCNLIQIILESRGNTQNKSKRFIRKIYAFIIRLRNKLIPNKSGDILFFRYGIDDFRTGELLGLLKKNYKILQVTGVSYKHILSNFLNRDIYILPLIQIVKKNNVFLDDDVDDIFKSAIFFSQSIVNVQRYNYHMNFDNFKRFEYKLFFGLDDANTVYPLIYAAQDVGIKTLGFQHGVYARRHEAYVMKGIEKYRWYDNVLVWGQYWKDNVLKHSSLYSDEFHITCSNKHSYIYQTLPKKGKDKVILIPYEFLSDSIKVGEYVRKFINAGFKVLFKPRTDELLESQLQAYFIDDIKSKIKILDIITPETMAEVDIIAGTQTTLLFDLLPYNKPIWILESSFRLMYDMVEDGLARLITESDMQRIDEIFEEEICKERAVDPIYFSGEQSVVNVLKKHLKSGVVD